MIKILQHTNTIALLLWSATAWSQTGTVKGSVYYSSYSGNRADVGSEVFILSATDSLYKQTKVDLQGSFEFANLAPGRYLVAIASANTTDDGVSSFVRARAVDMKPYLGFSYQQLNPILYDSILSLKDQTDSLLMLMIEKEPYSSSWNKLNRRRLKLREKASAMVAQLISSGPINHQTMRLHFLRLPHKNYRLQHVNVEAGNETKLVIDFGISHD